MGLIYFVIFGVPARPEIAAEAGGTAIYVLKSAFLIPQQVAPLIDVGWTLTYEMYFYCVFAIALILPRRLLPILLFIWALQICAFQWLSFDNAALRIMRSPLSLEFIGGAFMALLVLGRIVILPKIILSAGISAFCIALLSPEITEDVLKRWGRLIFFGLPAMAIIYGLVSLEIQRKFKAPQWSVHLGNWSYSLYLGHVIVLLIMKNVWEVLESLGMPNILSLSAPGIIDNIVFSGAVIFAALLAAWLSYRFIERPLMRVLRRTSS